MLEPNRHYSVIRDTFIFFAGVPLFSQLPHFLAAQLPANIFAELVHTFGHAAIVLSLLVLAITPLRRWLAFLFTFSNVKWGKRLADWNFLIQLRRPLGLCAFFYMLLHILFYLYLELGFSWQELVYEIQHREFLFPGLLAAIIMTALALTSPAYCRRKLGRWWRILHRGIYLLCPLAVIHYLWFAKATDRLPWLYFALIVVLLAHRIMVTTIKRFSRSDDTGMEVSRTASQNRSNSGLTK